MIEGLEEHLEIYETKHGFKRSRWVCNAKDVEKATEDLQKQNKNLKEEIKDLKKQLKQKTAQSDANVNSGATSLKCSFPENANAASEEGLPTAKFKRNSTNDNFDTTTEAKVVRHDPFRIQNGRIQRFERFLGKKTDRKPGNHKRLHQARKAKKIRLRRVYMWLS